MFCPHCGSHIALELATRFCPECGQRLPYIPVSERRYPESGSFSQTSQKPSAKKNKKIAGATACIVIALVFVSLIGAAQIYDEYVLSGKVEVQQITDDTYFELSGDFLPEKEVFTVSLTSDGKIAFALNDDLSQKYDHYSWWLFDKDHISSTDVFAYSKYTGERLEKTEPVLYYLQQKPGEYSVSVTCYVDTDGQLVRAAAYSGTVSYIGYITKDYSWKYKGEDYNVQVTFRYDVYRHYRDLIPDGRAVTNYNRVASFITYEEPVVTGLAESLREAYGIGLDMTGQDFAAFVLAFVQICFEYPPHTPVMGADEYQYGQSEYFAYPLETIFYGMGDCEDTSILAAALFKALGYNAGFVALPGHALAAIGLDEYASGSYLVISLEILSQTIGDITYYGCETTVDEPQGIGLVSKSGDDGRPYSWYIGKNSYGFYPV